MQKSRIHRYLKNILLGVGSACQKIAPKTITFAGKRKLLLVIEIQEALWRKLNNLKAPDLAATKSVKFATEGH